MFKTKVLMGVTTAAATLAFLSPGVSADEVDYTVQAGDTLSKIAQEHLGSAALADELAIVNGISNPDLIYVGQTLTFDGVTGNTNTSVSAGQVASLPVAQTYDATSEYSDGNVTYQAPSVDYNYSAPSIDYNYQSGGNVVLSNGNTAGSIGLSAAAEMEARTGVPASTWEYIIARESNGDPNAYNPSGASGLFQTMPGWGSTATVEDQINAAVNAYNNQGLAAWAVY